MSNYWSIYYFLLNIAQMEIKDRSVWESVLMYRFYRWLGSSQDVDIFYEEWYKIYELWNYWEYMLFNRFQRLINNRLLWYSVGHIMSTPQCMYLSPFYFMLHKDKKTWNCWTTRARWSNICSNWFNINLVIEFVVFEFSTCVFMRVFFL